MVFTPVTSDKWLQKEDRRSHPRRRCEQLDYTDFGPDNGGILLDFSEGGLGFQGVRPVDEGQIICLKFTLPGTSTHIEAHARVARSNDSRKGGGLRFVDLSEETRRRVRLWVSGATTQAPPSGIFRSEADGRRASAAMNPPELAAADSPVTEQVRIFEAARISGAPKAKPDEAEKTQVISFAEHGASNKSLESAASFEDSDEGAATLYVVDVPPVQVAASSDGGGVHQTSLDQTAVDRAQVPTEPLKPSPSPGLAAREKASAFAPDPSTPEPFRVSSPAPKPTPDGAMAATGAWETPRQTLRSPYSLGLQTPGTTNIRSAGMPNMQGELPNRPQIERRAYEQQDCKAPRMLLDFYGLQEQPFGITPDPAYLYTSRTHGEAFASLSFGIHDNRGLLALIAEPGMGKTTLLKQLLEDLRNSARTVFVFQTQCDSRELFQYILHELDVDAQGMGLVAMHNKLNELLCAEMLAGKRFVLIVDEAQNLDESVLETVRMLSNFETRCTKLLQIVLAGQPPLAAKLAHPQLSQLRQRIAVLSHLEPFTAAETACYVDHRLRVAGYCGEPLFAPDAVGLIARRSRGIPRNINNICYNSLLVAFVRGHGTVTSEIVQEAGARLAIESLVPQPIGTADSPVTSAT
jgi:type II secretory pathway predicted ATPase ExeA